MAINYAEKYSGIIDEKFVQSSITNIAVNKDFEFDGVNKVNVYSIPVVPLNDYNLAAASNRYGNPVELGNDVQTLELTQDKAFSFSIDKRNYEDTMLAASAASALARQIQQVIVPTIDKYRIAKLVTSVHPDQLVEETLTEETAYSAFLDASMVLFDAYIPSNGRVVFVSPAFYKAIKLDKNFTQSGDKAFDIAVNGVVGKIDNTAVVVVPTDYLPDNVNFIITHPSAMTSPIKLSDYKQHESPQGIDGWLVEGRIYYDAFVLNNKKKAIYVSIKPATP